MGTGFLTVPGTVSRGPFGSLFLSVIIAILQRAAPENNFYLTFHESTMQIVPNSCKKREQFAEKSLLSCCFSSS
jgi:hypothetical protein